MADTDTVVEDEQVEIPCPSCSEIEGVVQEIGEPIVCPECGTVTVPS